MTTNSEQEPGGPAVCECPDCDYETAKKRGVPCRSMTCPECGAKLVAKTEEEAESMKNIGQIAKSAIETALAVVNESKELTKERAVKLLYALETDLAEIWEAGDVAVTSVSESATLVTDFVLVPEGTWTATDLLEALTKKVSGRTHVKGDFLVMEDSDKVTTWHLPVRVNGKVNHGLMGAAKAALTAKKGFRGRPYAGPDKAKALKKLKALYKSEDMEWMVKEAQLGETDGSLRDMASRVEDAFRAAFQPDTNWTIDRSPRYYTRDVYKDHPVLGDVLVVDDRTEGKMYAISYTDSDEGIEFSPRQEWQSVELTYTAESIAESASNASGIADFEGDLAELGIDAIAETGRRAPVLVDFQVLKPGPGNKRDNHYYPKDVVERDANVFDGVDIFATDHKENERSERTKVGRVQTCPTRFTEVGAPVAQVVIYDPDQAEKTRNRNDADELATMECSIYARGISEAGEVGGKSYKIVKQITEGKYLELVSSAGAGGHALNLAESETGGNTMSETENVAEGEIVEEEDIQESETPAEEETTENVEEVVAPLAEAEVATTLAETNLPTAFKNALGKAQYADAEVLKAAIAVAIKEVKALTGSGQPFGQGDTQPTELTEAEREEAAKAHFNKVMQEVGLSTI